MAKKSVGKPRAKKKDKKMFPHSVYLNSAQEKKLNFLMERGFQFTSLVNAIIDSEYELEMQEFGKEEFEKTVRIKK